MKPKTNMFSRRRPRRQRLSKRKATRVRRHRQLDAEMDRFIALDYT
jgi:hypothetical protein